MRGLEWLGFDRPAGALLGACAMVICAVLTPWEALAAVDGATLLGSVANVIVAEAAREIEGLGLRQHMQVGLPLACVTTAIGAAWLCMMA